MRIRNILLGGMFVVLMAGCSKDETVDYSTMGSVDAYVSFGVKTDTQTKATTDDSGTNVFNNEANIKSLTAYIFKISGADTILAANKTVSLTMGETTINEIKHLNVKVTPTSDGTSSSDTFVAVFLGNCEISSTPSTLTNLRKMVLTKNADNYAFGDYLPMVSKIIKFTGLKPNIKTETLTTTSTTFYENWVKTGGGITTTEASTTDPETISASLYPSSDYVVMTRLISRVQVESISVKLTDYPGASLKVVGVALANVKPQSTFEAGTGDYLRGYSSTAYAPVQYWIAPNSSIKDSFKSSDYEIKAANGATTTTTFENTDTKKFIKYIFSNGARTSNDVNAAHTDGIYETGLIIIADFTNAANVTTRTHMRVLLKDASVDNITKVLPNYIYKLTISVTGEGSPNEDDLLLNAHVSAKVVVNPWNVVDITENDAN